MKERAEGTLRERVAKAGWRDPYHDLYPTAEGLKVEEFARAELLRAAEIADGWATDDLRSIKERTSAHRIRDEIRKLAE